MNRRQHIGKGEGKGEGRKSVGQEEVLTERPRWARPILTKPHVWFEIKAFLSAKGLKGLKHALNTP